MSEFLRKVLEAAQVEAHERLKDTSNAVQVAQEENDRAAADFEDVTAALGLMNMGVSPLNGEAASFAKSAQAYQVIGELAAKAGLFESEEVGRALDYFSEDRFDPEFLPWTVEAEPVNTEAVNDPDGGAHYLVVRAAHDGQPRVWRGGEGKKFHKRLEDGTRFTSRSPSVELKAEKSGGVLEIMTEAEAKALFDGASGGEAASDAKPLDPAALMSEAVAEEAVPNKGKWVLQHLVTGNYLHVDGSRWHTEAEVEAGAEIMRFATRAEARDAFVAWTNTRAVEFLVNEK